MPLFAIALTVTQGLLGHLRLREVLGRGSPEETTAPLEFLADAGPERLDSFGTATDSIDSRPVAPCSDYLARLRRGSTAPPFAMSLCASVGSTNVTSLRQSIAA